MLRHPIPPRQASGFATRGAFAVVLAAVAALLSCDDPQSPAPGSPPGDTEFRGTYDGTRGIEFRLESPGGGPSPLRLVATDLALDPATQDLHAQVAVRNAGSDPHAGPSRILVGGFEPEGVEPRNALGLPCPLCPRCPCPWPWAFVHEGTYGEDGMLDPGETSVPVEWIIHDPDGASFAFRARPEFERSPAPGIISGSVFVDGDGNGRREPGEPGIAGATVGLVHGDSTGSTTTDGDGRFGFEVQEEGFYEVVREPGEDCRPTTPGRLQVVILRRPDGSLSGFDRADFGCRGNLPPDSGVVVSGTVFEDRNRDGHWQHGERGVPGVLVTGETPFCPTFAPIEARTDERGHYAMRLPACEPPYVIGHAPVEGYVDTSPNPIVFDRGTDPDSTPGGPPQPPPGTTPPPGGWPPHHPPVPPDPRPGPPIPPGVPHLVADFGIATADSLPHEVFLVGFVFHDLDRNGRPDDGEPGIPDIGVGASGLVCMIPIGAFTRTDSSGHYRLRAADIHCPPPWAVMSEIPPGNCPTSPLPVIVTPAPGDETIQVDFGFAPCDSLPPPPPPPPPNRIAIEGSVFADLNRDGTRQPGEPGIPAVEVQLLSPCTVLRATRTDARGHYLFPPDVVGQCPVTAVAQTAPPFPHRTTPNPVPVDLSGVPPGTVLAIDFGIDMRRGNP